MKKSFFGLAGKRHPERAGRPSWVKAAETLCPRLRSFDIRIEGAELPPPRTKVGGGIVFDRRLKFGIGATGHTQDIGYYGAVVPMTPTTFSRLTTHRPEVPDFVRGAADVGKAFGTPILYLEFDPVSRAAEVVGHEGRGRMIVTRERAGNVPVPVAVVVRKTIYGCRGSKESWKSNDVEQRARTWSADTVAALNYCVLPEAYRGDDWRVIRRKIAPVTCAFPEVYVGGKKYTTPECKP